jgi:hypothetical protein
MSLVDMLNSDALIEKSKTFVLITLMAVFYKVKAGLILLSANLKDTRDLWSVSIPVTSVKQ